MDTEGPQSDKGREEPPGDNVVPFPRDWLGSRDELVPFGRRAEDDESPGAGRKPAQGGASGPSEPAEWPSAAPSAADFWSEDSMALHDVVRAPETPPGNRSAGARRDDRVASGPREGDHVSRSEQQPADESDDVELENPEGEPGRPAGQSDPEPGGVRRGSDEEPGSVRRASERGRGGIQRAGRPSTGMRIAAAVSLAALLAAAVAWRVVSISSPSVAGGAGSGSGGSFFGGVGNALKGNLDPIGGLVLSIPPPRRRQAQAARRRPTALGHRSAHQTQAVAAVSVGSSEAALPAPPRTSSTGYAVAGSSALNTDYIQATPGASPSASVTSSAGASASVARSASASGTPSSPAPKQQAAVANERPGRPRASSSRPFGLGGALGPGSSPNG